MSTPARETLAAQGFYVFPVDSETKEPLVKWRDVSTRTRAEVRQLWKEFPGAGVGIDCGKSGLVVADLDVKRGEDGPGNWDRRTAEMAVPATFRVRTPSGGLHLYFRDMFGVYRNSAGTLAPGVDVRGDGGYVVGPDGKGYHWDGEAPSTVDDIPEAPAGAFTPKRTEKVTTDPFSDPWEDAAKSPAYALSMMAGVLAELRTAREGGRNALLNRAGFKLGRLVPGLLDLEAVRESLLDACGSNGLLSDDGEAACRASMESGLAAGMANPERVTGSAEEVVGANSADPSPSPWAPLDLDAFLDGEGVPPPEVGKREDGRAMFYPERVNDIHGESESGKSWLALVAAADEITSGRDVSYLDWEDSGHNIVERLTLLGASREAILKHFRYVNPSGPLDDAAREALGPVLSASTLCVIDATTEALSMFGMSSNSDVEVADFFRVLPRWAASLGPAVVLIDHVPKAVDNRTGPTGSQHKRSAIDGASYLMEPVQPFARGGNGRSRVKVAKDRPGHVRAVAADGKWFADFTLETRDSGALWPRLHVPLQDPRVKPRDGLLEEILAILRKAAEKDDTATTRYIRNRVSARPDAIGRALALLADSEQISVTPGPNRSQIHRIAVAEETAE